MNEATIFQSKYDSTFTDALKEFVSKHGVNVFQGGQAWVIDRGSYVWRVWFKDPGYERFLKYLESTPDSPHLPKILSKLREEPVQFSGMPNGMSIRYLKLEKLSPMSNGPFKDSVNALSFCNIRASEVPEDIVELLSKAKLFNDTGFGRTITPKDFRDQVLRNSKFFTLVLDLMRNHKANDIADENIMQRNGVPVITDPFAFS